MNGHDDGWSPVHLIVGEAGGAWAAIEAKGARYAPPAERPTDGVWTLSAMASLRKSDHRPIVDAPFTPARIQCLTHQAAEFIGRCAAGTEARSSEEHELVLHAGTIGLIEPCIHAIAPPARGAKDQADQAVGWTWEEARLWECFALAEGAPGERGTQWRGTRHHVMEALRAGDEGGGGHTISLEREEPLARAIPGSAATFSDVDLEKGQIERWLARFAAVRTSEWTRLDDNHLEIVTRGMPEAGGMGTLRLWLALNRVQDLDRGLYAYNALDHALRWITGDINAIVRRSMRSMGRIEDEPGGVMIISNRMRRMNAKYHRIGLGVALQNTGVCIGAAAVAGKWENIQVRGNGAIPGDEWIEATGIDPRQEAPVGAFAFGTTNNADFGTVKGVCPPDLRSTELGSR